MIRRIALALALLAAISGSACHGIGRPLVAKKKLPPTKDNMNLCGLAPSCKDDRLDDLASQIALIDTTPVDVSSCGASLRPCVEAVDAVGNAFSEKCVAGFGNDSAANAISLHTFNCTGMSITLSGKHPDPVLIDAAQLQQTEVVIEATSPAFVQLDNALLDDVRFTLRGPITLRLSHTRTLKRVRVLGSAPQANALTVPVAVLGPDVQDEPRVELQNIDGDDVSISGDDGSFPGTVAIENGTLNNTRIVAKTVQLTTMALMMSSIRVADLDTKNATLSLVTLAFDNGHLAGSTVSQTQITECKSLAIVTGTLSRMRFAACDEPVRVYGATIELAFMDGQIQADHATFQNVLFGAHEQTDLVAWDTDIFTSNFCKYSRTTRLGAAVFVLCPSCDPADTFIVCADSQSARKIETSQCLAFKDPDECGTALPERPKPPL